MLKENSKIICDLMRCTEHKFIMTKYLFIFLFLLLVNACQKDDLYQQQNGIPAYIRIEKIDLLTENSTQGSNSQLITDAWVYFDNQLQGIYPLPCTFPILLTGKQNISIKAGIKNNGIAATRVKYPFYDFFSDEITLFQDSAILINPTVSYSENTKFIMDDFENIGSIFSTTSTSDSSYYIVADTNAMEGKSLAAYLATDQLTFEIATNQINDLPRNGTPIYVELNYKSNTPFSVGVFANYPQNVISSTPIVIHPKSDWNKIYIDLTATIANTQGAEYHKLFINMRRDITNTEAAELYLDNFKLLY